MKIKIAAGTILWAMLAVQLCAQSGTIRGVVLNEKGLPISGAKVYDEPMGSVRIGKDHFVETGPDGRFELGGVPAGKTMIIATKTELGYPDARFALYSGNEVLPVVELTPGQGISGVIVKLLAKGGTLKGLIRDSRSGVPVNNSRILLSRVDHPEWSLETDPATNGSFEFVIPSKPMHVQVSAPGYKTWVYEKSSFSMMHAPLSIAPEATLQLSVNLEPIIK